MKKAKARIVKTRSRERVAHRSDPAAIMARAAELTTCQPLRTQAELLGMNYETIRRFHRGMNPPSLEYVTRLCLATGVSSVWLLFGRGAREAEGREPGQRRGQRRPWKAGWA